MQQTLKQTLNRSYLCRKETGYKAMNHLQRHHSECVMRPLEALTTSALSAEVQETISRQIKKHDNDQAGINRLFFTVSKKSTANR